jgi:hypothetical protein
MGRRAVVLFWGAAAAAVLLLGSAWATARQFGSGPHELVNAAVMTISVIGLGASTLWAGRIAFVVGRAQRRASTGPSGHPIARGREA